MRKTLFADLLLTAAAPIIWGTSYIVATEFLPEFSPVTVAMLRALPAGLLLMAFSRQLPTGIWWLRAALCGCLNIALLMSMLFISAYRLPGGVAATIGSVQPLIVVFLSYVILSTPIRIMSVVSAISGAGGVALLVLTPQARLDLMGIVAGITAAVSMAVGTVLIRKWQPPVSLVTFAAWQLTAGGIMLMPVVLIFEPRMPLPTATNVVGLIWLSLVGGILTHLIWIRGVRRLDTSSVSSLGLLSPVTATLLGWVILAQTMSYLQVVGAIIVLVSIWSGHRTRCSTVGHDDVKVERRKP